MLLIIFNQSSNAPVVIPTNGMRLRRIPFECFDDYQLVKGAPTGHVGGGVGFGRVHLPAIYRLMQEEWARNQVARMQREELLTSRLAREAAEIQLFHQVQVKHHRRIHKSAATMLLTEMI